MDSSQKVLKELSELTRNLDSLAKEVRDSNKGNASVQKAVAQSVETKKEESKSASSSAEKTATDSQKSQESMFSKLLGTVKKSFEDGNELFKSASLKTLQSAGKTLLETGSLKEAAKSGIEEAKDEGKKAAKQKAEQAIDAGITKVTETPDLKMKEKPAKENLTVDGAINPSTKPAKTGEKENGFKNIFKIPTNQAKGKEMDTKKLDAYVRSLSKEEQMSIINGLNTGKITRDDLEKRMNESGGSKAALTTPSLSGSVKTPEALNPKVTPTKAPEESTKKTFGETLKEGFEKSKLGSTFKALSSLTKKKENLSVAETGMKNEAPALKDQSKPSSAPPKPQEEVKKEMKTKPSKSTEPVRQDYATGDKPKGSPASSAGSSSPSKDKEPQISSQDIQDIKGLLAAINTTLSGPLLLKDNKPFRPKSNMLE